MSVMNSLRRHCVTVWNYKNKTINQITSRLLCTHEVPPIVVKRPQEYSVPKGTFGQPTSMTHPHLIPNLDHLTCGTTQAEYRVRRAVFAKKLLSKSTNPYLNHVILIPGACKKYMSDKIPFVFRQNSDFFYLTGCMEPGAALVMHKAPKTDDIKTILFVHDKDPHAELWEGPRTGCANSVQLFGVDEARNIESLPTFLNKVTNPKPSLLWYHTMNPANPEISSSMRSIINEGSTSLGDPMKALHEMRLIKSKSEIELMKQTCIVGSQAINVAMACTKPGVSESTINAVLEYTCKQNGAEQLAFPPVVAGGARATHIHYVTNNQILNEDDMLLVDSGCQRWLYNSDISRTWPVSGKFSKYHRILYELVLCVQKRLIEVLGQERPPLNELFDHMCRLLGSHLQAEGIIPRDIHESEVIQRAYKFCPHHVSHYLGMDVHDTSLINRSIPLKTNMVVTIEPGLYIRPDDMDVPAEFRGVGIRIEDDVLITDDEPYILTSQCVKEVEDIENLVGKHTV